jgi:hypothetical protein
MVRPIPIIAMMLALALSTASAGQDNLSPLARSIQDEVNLLDSRVGARQDQQLQSDRIQRTERERGRAARLFAPTELRSARDIALGSDLHSTQQDLRTLKTQEPNNDSVPVLERQLDRIGREAGGTILYQPSRNPAALYGR